MREMKDIISSRRRERNMTQEQLAAALGVSAKVVSKWETGRSLPDTVFLLPLCRALEITAEELLGAAAPAAEAPAAGAPAAPEAGAMPASGGAEGTGSLAEKGPRRKRGPFFTAEIVGGAFFVFAVALFLCGRLISWSDYWGKRETLTVVLYILAAFFLTAGGAAYLLLRARAADRATLAEDKKCAFRDICFVFAAAMFCIVVLFGRAMEDSPQERKNFAVVALLVAAAISAVFAGLLVWNRRRK